ncbi:hypothetical protein QUF80_14510 [Desulfococcaceae bacterium HSG8]|nr:hypothetical protein [Desulfococcaceae bacterium HSG8]
MDESNVPIQEEVPGMSSKEMKQLLWMGIVSVWLTMALILYTGSTNYRGTLKVGHLSETASALTGEVAQIRADLASNTAKINELAEKILGGQKADTESFQKLLGGQQEMTEKLSSDAAKVSQSVEKLLEEQKTVVGDIKNASAYNVEKTKILKKFIDAQTVLLNHLSKAFEKPTADQ